MVAEVGMEWDEFIVYLFDGRHGWDEFINMGGSPQGAKVRWDKKREQEA